MTCRYACRAPRAHAHSAAAPITAVAAPRRRSSGSTATQNIPAQSLSTTTSVVARERPAAASRAKPFRAAIRPKIPRWTTRGGVVGGGRSAPLPRPSHHRQRGRTARADERPSRPRSAVLGRLEQEGARPVAGQLAVGRKRSFGVRQHLSSHRYHTVLGRESTEVFAGGGGRCPRTIGCAVHTAHHFSNGQPRFPRPISGLPGSHHARASRALPLRTPFAAERGHRRRMRRTRTRRSPLAELFRAGHRTQSNPGQHRVPGNALPDRADRRSMPRGSGPRSTSS